MFFIQFMVSIFSAIAIRCVYFLHYFNSFLFILLISASLVTVHPLYTVSELYQITNANAN